MGIKLQLPILVATIFSLNFVKAQISNHPAVIYVYSPPSGAIVNPPGSFNQARNSNPIVRIPNNSNDEFRSYLLCTDNLNEQQSLPFQQQQQVPLQQQQQQQQLPVQQPQDNPRIISGIDYVNINTNPNQIERANSNWTVARTSSNSGSLFNTPNTSIEKNPNALHVHIINIRDTDNKTGAANNLKPPGIEISKPELVKLTGELLSSVQKENPEYKNIKLNLEEIGKIFKQFISNFIGSATGGLLSKVNMESLKNKIGDKMKFPNAPTESHSKLLTNFFNNMMANERPGAPNNNNLPTSSVITQPASTIMNNNGRPGNQNVNFASPNNFQFGNQIPSQFKNYYDKIKSGNIPFQNQQTDFQSMRNNFSPNINSEQNRNFPSPMNNNGPLRSQNVNFPSNMNNNFSPGSFIPTMYPNRQFENRNNPPQFFNNFQPNVPSNPGDTYSSNQ